MAAVLTDALALSVCAASAGPANAGPAVTPAKWQLTTQVNEATAGGNSSAATGILSTLVDSLRTHVTTPALD